MEIAPDCKFNGTGASLACGLFRRRFAAVWLSDDSFLRDPLISWGNAATWDGFRTHFLREEYGTFRLGIAEFKHGGLLLTRISLFFEDLNAQLSSLGKSLRRGWAFGHSGERAAAIGYSRPF